MSEGLRVAVSGATGKTGGAVALGLVAEPGIDLVACISGSGTRPQQLPADWSGDCVTTVDDAPAFDVLVDFTHAGISRSIIEQALVCGNHVVLGTTGIDDSWLESMGDRFAAAGLGLIYAPNFALGAVLSMGLAEQVARTMPDATVEIVETHGPAKLDSPSGTARLTAQRIGAARAAAGHDASAGPDSDPASRGELIAGVPTHALRLAGAVAHQEIRFGMPGQLLTIRHDAIDRSCYVPGVVLALRHVAERPGLTIGLEALL